MLLFALIAAASGYGAFQLSRRHAVVPPTSVTSAFDYTDDQSELFDGERRTYGCTIRPSLRRAGTPTSTAVGSARCAGGGRPPGSDRLIMVIVVAAVVTLVGTLHR